MEKKSIKREKLGKKNLFFFFFLAFDYCFVLFCYELNTIQVRKKEVESKSKEKKDF
jgi:hypothetical protein